MPVFIISGPTGSGKTAVAKALAESINGEIISADSRQVYKYLDIGTNKEGVWNDKMSARFLGTIPQYLTDIIEPSQTYSAGDFAFHARSLIEKIKKDGKTPVIAGGTGLYIKALCDGLAPLPKADPAVRSELHAQLEEHGREYLYNELLVVDPESAEMNKGNPQRLIRSLEVYRLTGIPLSVWHKETKGMDENFAHIGLAWPREELYDRLNRRTRAMLDGGMIEETKRALDMGFMESSPGLQGIGYKQVVRFLKKEISYKELEEEISTSTRNYAKRQVTWFKKDSRIRWIEATEKTFDADVIAGNIVKTYGI